MDCCSFYLRYLPPTDEELKHSAGIVNHHGKKSRKDHRNDQKKDTFTLLKSTPIELDSIKVTPLDVVPLPFYQDYQWLLDFSLFSVINYVLTEIYYAIFQPSHDVNLSVLWCLLAIGFSLKILLSLTVMYFRTEDSSERILCILFGFFFLLMAMGVLIVDEEVLEFGLVHGYKAFAAGANQFLKTQEIQSGGPASLLTFRIALAITSGIIGAFLTFPGLRLAKMHSDSLKYTGGNPFKAVLLHLNIISPLFIALLWVKPLAKNYIIGRTYYGFTVMSDPETFDTIRVLLLIGFCLSRFVWCWTHFQAHLNMAYEKIVALRKEAGRIASEEIQRIVSSVYVYLCVVALQYLAPLILLLFLTLLLKTLGEFSFSEAFGISIPTVIKNVTDTKRSPVAEYSEVLPESVEQMAKEASVQVKEAIASLHIVFTAECFRGLFSYFCWWICTVWFTTSAFGLMYYSFLVDN